MLCDIDRVAPASLAAANTPSTETKPSSRTSTFVQPYRRDEAHLIVVLVKTLLFL